METNTSDVPKVQCELCLKLIPQSEAKSAEAVDYVVYFCGLECFEKWATQRRKDELAVGSD